MSRSTEASAAADELVALSGTAATHHPAAAPKRTVFVCVRQKNGTSKGTGCANRGARDLVTSMRQMLLKESLQAELHVQPCGCLGLCKQGPVVLAALGAAAQGNKPRKPGKKKSPGISLGVDPTDREAVRQVLREVLQLPAAGPTV